MNIFFLKHFKTFVVILIVIFNHSFVCACEFTNLSKPILIRIITPGFNKAFLYFYTFHEEKKIIVNIKKKNNLKKSDIREFEFQPENKPSGFKILQNTYIKPRVSAGYMMEVAKDINGSVGVDNRFLEEDSVEDKNKNEPSAEGGIEVRYYF